MHNKYMPFFYKQPCGHSRWVVLRNQTLQEAFFLSHIGLRNEITTPVQPEIKSMLQVLVRFTPDLQTNMQILNFECFFLFIFQSLIQPVGRLCENETTIRSDNVTDRGRDTTTKLHFHPKHTRCSNNKTDNMKGFVIVEPLTGVFLL